MVIDASQVKPQIQFESLVHSIDGIVWEADACSFAFTFVSKQTERILGYAVEQWTEEPDFWTNHVHADDRERVADLRVKATNNKENHQLEYRMTASDGRVVWFKDIVTVHVVDDRVVRLSGVLVDITANRSSDENILKEKRLTETILNSLPGAFYMFNEHGERVLWNKYFEEVTGDYGDEIAQMPLLHYIAEEHKPLLKQAVEEVFTKGRSTAEADMILKDGSRVPYFVTGRRVMVDGRPHLVGMAMDITERKRAEERINLLQLITIDVAEATDLNSALEVVLRHVCEKTGWALGQAWVPNSDGTVLDCCPAWFASETGLEEFRTLTKEFVFRPGIGLPGRTWKSREPVWVPDVTVDTNFPRAEFGLQAGLKAGLGVPIITGDEVIAVLEFFMRGPREEDERLVKVISSVAAQIGLVIERKRAEQELRRVSDRLRLATRAAGIGIWDWDVVKDELVWDDAMYRLFGIGKEDFSGAYAAWANSLVPEDLAQASDKVQKALRGEGEFDPEFRIVWPDGSIHFIQAGSQTFRDETGQPVRMVGVNYDVTNRKLAEEQLRWSEERLRLLLDSTAEGIFGVDLDGRCSFCNASGLRLLGYDDPDELMGQDMHALIAHSRDDGRPYPAGECPVVESLKSASNIFAADDVFWRKNGTSFPTEYWSYPMFMENKHVGAVVTFVDITERKLAEESLRLSEERFSKAFHASPEPISIFRYADGVLLEINERWLSVYGYTTEEAIGTSSLDLTVVNPVARDRLRNLLEKQDSVRGYEIDLKTKQGEVRNVSLSAEKIVINNEICTIFLHHDITEQKRAEAENKKLIHDLGERVKELTALRRTASVLQDEAKNVSELLKEIVTLLPAAWQYPEITAGRIIFGSMEFRTPNFAPAEWSLVAEFTAAGVPGTVEVVYLEERPTRDLGPFLTEERNLIDSLAEMLSSALNRRYAREELRESQRRFSDTLSNLDMIAVMADVEGNITFCNDYLLRLTGWEREEAIGRNWFEMFIPEKQKELVSGILDKVPAEGTVTPHFENEIKTRSGERRLVKWTNTTLRDPDGTFLGVAALGDDITEAKRSEEQIKTTTEQLRALTVKLRHAREEEGTRIAREIHDELGSALTSLKWDLETLDKTFSRSENHFPLPELRAKVAGMTGLIDSTVNVVRRISAELRPSILDDLGLDAAIEWQAAQFQSRTGITCVCDCSMENTELNKDQSTAVFRIFQEALTNVLRHAQASKIEIAMEKPGGEFILTISDNGRGITDSEKSESHSLGLLGMRERAVLIGGQIDIQGIEGKGTAITVRVPLCG